MLKNKINWHLPSDFQRDILKYYPSYMWVETVNNKDTDTLYVNCNNKKQKLTNVSVRMHYSNTTQCCKKKLDALLACFLVSI